MAGQIRSEAMASGAIEVLKSAEVFEQTGDAVWDLNRLFATTARQGDLAKVVTPKEAAKLFFDSKFAGIKLVFCLAQKGPD